MMHRLTEKDKQGNWKLKGVDWQQLAAVEKKIWEKLYGALAKLKDYEETGLQPDEVEKVKEENRWIPVEERMPEERDSVFAKFKTTKDWKPGMFEKTSEKVLATVEYQDGARITEIVHTIDGKWKIGIPPYNGKVIAWMPFPEPYRGAEE